MKIYQFIALILSMAVFPGPCFSETTPHPDQVKIERSIELFNSKELQETLSAIYTLASLNYSEVNEILIDLTLQELKTRKNKFIVEKLLRELVSRVDKSLLFDKYGVAQSDSKLLLLSLELEMAVRKDSRYEKVKKQFLDLNRQMIEYAKKREIDRPSLPSFQPTLIKENQPHTTLEYKKFQDEMTALKAKIKAKSNGPVKAGNAGPVEILMAGTTRYITDEIYEDIINDRLLKIINREDILERVLLILARYRQQNVALLGSKGSGKTAIVELLAESIVTDSVSQNEVTEFLKNAVIVQTTTGRISSLAKTDKPAGQAEAIEAYFQSLSEVQKLTGRRIIVFIDEFHTLTKEQVETIKPYIESSKSNILLIAASTSPEYRSAFKHNEALLSRMQDTAVPELSEEDLLYILKESWLKIIAIKYKDLQVDDEALKLIIRKSQLLYPDKGSLRAMFNFTEDIANYLKFKKPKDPVIITSEKIYFFIKHQIGLPVDPTDFVEMQKYRQNLHDQISQDIFGQERLISDVVDLWMGVLRNESSRGVKVGMIMGRSGTGKTETIKRLAKYALGSPERVLTIKGSDYAEADDIKLSEIFGVPGGVRFGQHTSGKLMEFLDDPSRGKYAGIIIFDEIEKASPLLKTRLMEMLDTSSIFGGDTKERYLRKHLIIMTSNRGDQILFPPETELWSDKDLTERTNSFSEEDLKSLFEKPITKNDNGVLQDSFLNRIDMFTISELITPNVAKAIARRILNEIREEYEDRSNVRVEVTDHTLEEFVRVYEPQRRGARPLVRALERYIRNSIELTLGKIPFQRGDYMKIEVDKDEKKRPVLRSQMNGQEVMTSLPRFSMNAQATFKCMPLLGLK